MQAENSLYYNELAIASLTIGILSFIQLFGLEKSVAAIVFGALALKRIKQDQTQRGKNLAVGGIILGVAYSVFALIMLPHAIEVIKKVMGAIK